MPPDSADQTPGGSSTTSSESEPKEKNGVAQHLESIVRGCVEAINVRDFDPKSPAWKQFSGDFFNDPDGPAFQVPDSTLKSRLWTYTIMSFEDLMNFHRTVSNACPGYATHITEMAMTDINERVGYAQVLVSATTTGIPEGVTRPNLSLFNFRKVDGEWLCVSLRSLPGLDYTGPF